ncbi:trypsin-like serine protease [Corynebacterium freiburgense]|uniref:trypsin-like serine protease n=1 Tax=Corynebacterium freiburgense TaxID=556548 RepID=UPI000410ABCC|nr:trypsin-like serine protease [Corynebacterium freiburgense]WJZ02256.1 putative peptidase precursor [Corynebacterium freiburgense]
MKFKRLVAALAIFGSITTATPAAHAVVGGRPGGTASRVILGDMSCSGTLISPTWVLSAKHCVGNGDANSISVNNEIRHATNVYMHPTVELAVIELNAPVGAAPTAISGAHLYPGTVGVVEGWGGVAQHHFLQPQAADATVQRRVFNVPGATPDQNLIEAWVNRGRITHGDSGGPFIVNGQLAGVTAYSNQGNDPAGTVAWYVPVAEHLDWIQRQTGIPVPGQIGGPAPLVDAVQHPTQAPAVGPVLGSSYIDSLINYPLGSS